MIDFNDPTLHDRLFIYMSANFLTEKLPDEAIDWDEDEIEEFVERHVWEPLEYISADNVVDMISSAAYSARQFMRQELLATIKKETEE